MFSIDCLVVWLSGCLVVWLSGCLVVVCSAYRQVVIVQQLSEMEEIIQYFTLCKSSSREASQSYVAHLRQMWASRLRGCQRNVDVWQKMLRVRTLIGLSADDMDSGLKFASLCRRSGRLNTSRKVSVTGCTGCTDHLTVLSAHLFTGTGGSRRGHTQHAGYGR